MNDLLRIDGITAFPGTTTPVVAVLSGLRRSERVQALFEGAWLQARAILRLELNCAPPCPATLWRLETGWGAPLNDSPGLQAGWQRPPYAVTIRLVQYEPG